MDERVLGKEGPGERRDGGDGGSGGVVAAPEAWVVPVLVPVPDGVTGGVGDWAVSAAASIGMAGSGGMIGGKA